VGLRRSTKYDFNHVRVAEDSRLNEERTGERDVLLEDLHARQPIRIYGKYLDGYNCRLGYSILAQLVSLIHTFHK
jgi:hypothetical protein